MLPWTNASHRNDFRRLVYVVVSHAQIWKLSLRDWIREGRAGACRGILGILDKAGRLPTRLTAPAGLRGWWCSKFRAAVVQCPVPERPIIANPGLKFCSLLVFCLPMYCL